MAPFLVLPENLDHVVVAKLLDELVHCQLVVEHLLPLDVVLVGDDLFVLVEVDGRRVGPHGHGQTAGNPEDKGIVHDLKGAVDVIGESVQFSVCVV